MEIERISAIWKLAECCRKLAALARFSGVGRDIAY